MDTWIALALAYVFASIAGLGASLSRPKALTPRILVGRLIVSGTVGVSSFVFIVSKTGTAPQEYWLLLWIPIVSGYSGPQIMQILKKRLGISDDAS